MTKSDVRRERLFHPTGHSPSSGEAKSRSQGKNQELKVEAVEKCYLLASSRAQKYILYTDQPDLMRDDNAHSMMCPTPIRNKGNVPTGTPIGQPNLDECHLLKCVKLTT